MCCIDSAVESELDEDSAVEASVCRVSLSSFVSVVFSLWTLNRFCCDTKNGLCCQYTIFPAPSLKPASGLVSKQRETDEGHIQSVKPCCGALEAGIDSCSPLRSALNVRCPMTQWIEPSLLSSSVRKATRRKEKKATTGTLFLTSTTRLSSSLMVGWPVHTR